jgi:hypothetical protein
MNFDQQFSKNQKNWSKNLRWTINLFWFFQETAGSLKILKNPEQAVILIWFWFYLFFGQCSKGHNQRL